MGNHRRLFTRRDILKAGFAVSSTALLAACSPAATSTPVSSTPASSTQGGTAPTSVRPAAATSVVEAAPQGAKVDVTFATYQWGEPSFSKFYTEAADAYHRAHPEVQIGKPTTPYTQYWDKMLIELQSGSPSDIYQAGFQNLKQYVDMGVLTPLDPYFQDMDWKKFYPSQQQYGVYGGKVYGVVLLNSGYNLIYNKDHFAKAGLKPPTTLDELLDDAKKLTNAPKQYGLTVMNTDTNELVGDIDNWLFGAAPDADWTKVDGTPDLMNQNVKDTLTFYKSLLDSGAVPMGTPKSDYRTMMLQGRISMMVDGPWYFGFALAQQPDALSFLDAVPVPTKTHVTPLASNVLMIAKNAAHKDEAGAFIRSLYTKEWQEEYVNVTLSPPGFANTFPPGFVEKNSWYKTYADLAGSTKLLTPPAFLSVSTEYGRILESVASGILFSGQPMDQALKDGNNQLEALRKRAQQ